MTTQTQTATQNEYAQFIKTYMEVHEAKGTGADVASKMGWDKDGEPDTGKVSQKRQYVNKQLAEKNINRELPRLRKASHGSGIEWDAITASVPAPKPKNPK